MRYAAVLLKNGQIVLTLTAIRYEYIGTTGNKHMYIIEQIKV